MAENVARAPAPGLEEFWEEVESLPAVLSLGAGEPGFETPWHIRDAAVFALEKGATRYTSNRGSPRLREAVARYVYATYGISYDPETEVVITLGVSEGLDLALRAILNPGDEVLYPQPGHPSYPSLIHLAYGRSVPVPIRTEDFTLTAEAVRQGISGRTRALILNFPHNPTGAVLTIHELREIAQVAEEKDLLVISDESAGDLILEGMPASIASLPGMKDRTVLLGGFSGPWSMAGFRVGFFCAPSPVADGMLKIHQYNTLCVAVVSQEAALEALRRPEGDLKRMRSRCWKNRNFLVRSLQEIGFSCFLPRGGIFAFPRVETLGMSSWEFARRLLHQERVAVVPGSVFGPGGEGHVRCSFALPLADLKEAVERLGRFVQRCRG